MMFKSLSPRTGGGASSDSPFPVAYRSKPEKQQSNNFLSILLEEKEGEDMDDSLIR